MHTGVAEKVGPDKINESIYLGVVHTASIQCRLRVRLIHAIRKLTKALVVTDWEGN
jgi:hypothetical protein